MRNWRNLFKDRLNRYRIAAVFLSLPTLYILIDDANFIDSAQELAIRVVYRTGLVILLTAIALDWWTVYTGKRKVKKMIEQKMSSNGQT